MLWSLVNISADSKGSDPSLYSPSQGHEGIKKDDHLLLKEDITGHDSCTVRAVQSKR